MNQETARVVKKEQVRLAGSCPVGGSVQQTPASAAQARIIEQGDGKAVVEVTCSCRRKIRIQCTY